MSLEFLFHLFPEVNNGEKHHKPGSKWFFIKLFILLLLLKGHIIAVRITKKLRSRTPVCLLLCKTHTFAQMFWNKHLCLCLHSN